MYNNKFTCSHPILQFLVRLSEFMSRHRYEEIGAFLHVVTPDEERALQNHPLRKILPLHNDIKKKCLQFYQPLRELSVDEQIVHSKARTHFRQYLPNKPTKWGFKCWVVADPTGYTIDFNSIVVQEILPLEVKMAKGMMLLLSY